MAFQASLALALLVGGTSSVAAISACLGTGELCAGVEAGVPGTTDADTVTLGYEVSSTLAPDIDQGDAYSCGVILVEGAATYVGAGCASENLRPYLFTRDHEDVVTPGTCVGTGPGVVPSGFCAAPGVAGTCVGVWYFWEEDPNTEPYHRVACSADDHVGVCYEKTGSGGMVLCNGVNAHPSSCPNGASGTQVFLIVNNVEFPLVCVAGAQFDGPMSSMPMLP